MQPLTPVQAEAYRAYKNGDVHRFYQPASADLDPDATRPLCEAIAVIRSNSDELRRVRTRDE